MAARIPIWRLDAECDRHALPRERVERDIGLFRHSLVVARRIEQTLPDPLRSPGVVDFHGLVEIGHALDVFGRDIRIQRKPRALSESPRTYRVLIRRNDKDG